MSEPEAPVFGGERLWSRYPVLRFFSTGHLPADLRRISEPFQKLAYDIAAGAAFANGAEKSACLRKLLEAKDCAVRSALEVRWADDE